MGGKGIFLDMWKLEAAYANRAAPDVEIELSNLSPTRDKNDPRCLTITVSGGMPVCLSSSSCFPIFRSKSRESANYLSNVCFCRTPYPHIR